MRSASAGKKSIFNPVKSRDRPAGRGRWLSAFTLLAGVMLLAAGCESSFKPHRPPRPLSLSSPLDPVAYWQGNPVEYTNSLRTNEFGFGVVEFDEQGEMWDRRQLTNILARIARDRQAGLPVHLIAFVHGWRHDAAAADANLSAFYDYVRAYAAVNVEPAGSQTKVWGVYLAWRGNVRTGSDLSWLGNNAIEIGSFFGRKSAARRVAGVSCTEALMSLAAQARLTPELSIHRSNAPPSKVILIGHSFGGLVVERAVSQALLGGLLASVPRREEAELLRLQFGNEAESLKRRSHDGVKKADELEAQLATRNCGTNLGSYPTLAKLQDELDRWSQGYLALLPQLAEKEHEFGRQRQALQKELTQLSEHFSKLIEPWPVPAQAPVRLELLHLGKNQDAFVADTGALQLTLSAITNRLQSITTNALLREADRKLIDRDSPALLQKIASSQQAIVEFVGFKERNDAAGLELQKQQNAILTNRAELARRKQAYTECDSTRLNLKLQVAALRNRAEVDNGLAADFSERAVHLRPPFQFPADLVILLNPASEAIIARQMMDALTNPLLVAESDKSSTNRLRPFIISVGSEGDSANRLWFPVGATFGSASTRLRDRGTGPQQVDELSQRKLFLHTAPNVEEMVSHKVQRTGPGTPANWSTNRLERLVEIIRQNYKEPSLTIKFSCPNGSFEMVDCPSANTSTYWIVRVDGGTIKNHNDIFNESVVAMVSRLASYVDDRDLTAKIAREQMAAPTQ